MGEEACFVLRSDNKHFSTTLQPIRQDGKSPNRVPTLTVIDHPKASRVGDRAILIPLEKGNAVPVSRNDPLFSPPNQHIGLPLEDPFLSRSPFFLKPGKKNSVNLIRGAFGSHLSVDGVPAQSSFSFAAEQLELGVVLTLAERIVLLLHWSLVPHQPSHSDHGLIGASDHIHYLRHEIERVADLPVPVLLRGDSGTGKEMIARAIHRYGRERNQPFVAVNMGAIPPSLAAAELFGALKGSFTGASRDQPGYFRQAQGGTLFLDEIGECPAEVQVMLLRALDTGEIYPVGAQRSVKVRTRVVAATDADLESKMADNSFKSPLFHRLSGYEIQVPPLRERREDLGRLFFYFARQEIELLGMKRFPEGVMSGNRPWLPAHLAEALLHFPWPGNVRQLRNVVRQLVIGCRGEKVLRMVPKVAHLMEVPTTPEVSAASFPQIKRKPSELDAGDLTAALAANGWDIKSTARKLGISRGSLYKRMKRTGLPMAGDYSKQDLDVALVENNGSLEKAAAALKISIRAMRRRMTEVGLPSLSPKGEIDESTHSR